MSVSYYFHSFLAKRVLLNAMSKVGHWNKAFVNKTENPFSSNPFISMLPGNTKKTANIFSYCKDLPVSFLIASYARDP